MWLHIAYNILFITQQLRVNDGAKLWGYMQQIKHTIANKLLTGLPVNYKYLHNASNIRQSFRWWIICYTVVMLFTKVSQITIITVLNLYDWKSIQCGIGFCKFFWISCLQLLFLNTNVSSWDLNQKFRILTVMFIKRLRLSFDKEKKQY
jgi:hypothetical protein